MKTLSGSLCNCEECNCDKQLTGELSKLQDLSGQLSQELDLYGELSGSIVTGGTYIGSYEVEPAFVEQILNTKNKIMVDDVDIHPIQLESVSNESGGNTVYIGGIING